MKTASMLSGFDRSSAGVTVVWFCRNDSVVTSGVAIRTPPGLKWLNAVRNAAEKSSRLAIKDIASSIRTASNVLPIAKDRISPLMNSQSGFNVLAWSIMVELKSSPVTRKCFFKLKTFLPPPHPMFNSVLTGRRECCLINWVTWPQ